MPALRGAWANFADVSFMVVPTDHGCSRPPPDLRRSRHPTQVIITAADVNDISQTLALVDGIPPVAGRPGRPPPTPQSPTRRQGLRLQPHDELRHRRFLPVISRKESPNIKGIGKLRYIVEPTFALLHHFKRLAVRWERRTELNDAFISLAFILICYRRHKNAHP